MLGEQDRWTVPLQLAEHAEIAKIVRDIFGNPFRPVKVNREWLTSTVVELARQIYTTKDFSILGILGDALQDAGCNNADVLEHCRAAASHQPGCWVVDLLLRFA